MLTQDCLYINNQHIKIVHKIYMHSFSLDDTAMRRHLI